MMGEKLRLTSVFVTGETDCCVLSVVLRDGVYRLRLLDAELLSRQETAGTMALADFSMEIVA